MNFKFSGKINFFKDEGFFSASTNPQSPKDGMSAWKGLTVLKSKLFIVS